MAELLKNRYNFESLHKVAMDIKSVYETFQVDDFLKSTINSFWDKLEFKDRLIQISYNLGKYLPAKFSEAISIIDKIVMNYGDWLDGFAGFFPIFVEIYGQSEFDWNVSMGALARYTRYASSELAVRAFIIKDENRMMQQMLEWSKSDDAYVRRLSCEGCRPALPWGQALISFKKDPTKILPILDRLKNDSSIDVRKSVANNLNDISKTHPDLVVEIAKDWYGKNSNTDWIVKHGCRTLLKKGNSYALALFGYDKNDYIDVQDFVLNTLAACIGEEIAFSFSVLSQVTTKVRLEYGIDYVKSNGKRKRKIFKISEVSLVKNEKKLYYRKHSLADVSVRKHYPGVHSIIIIVNGVERGILDFNLNS